MAIQSPAILCERGPNNTKRRVTRADSGLVSREFAPAANEGEAACHPLSFVIGWITRTTWPELERHEGNTMRSILIALNHRLTGEPFDSRVAQLACILCGIAIVPVSAVALVRHPGSQADFLFGLGLACLMALLFGMLGMLCRKMGRFGNKLAIWSRWREFASYCACLGIMIMGIRSVAVLGLSPIQITLALLLLCSLSLAVLVLGMMTTVVRSLKDGL